MTLSFSPLRFTLPKILLSLLLLIFMSTSNGATDAVSDTANSERAFHTFPAWFHDSPFLDLQEATTDAVEQSKKGVMILFTTQGCSYCEQFVRLSLEDSDIAKQVQFSFVSLGLEIFDDTELISPKGEALSVKEFAKREGAGFAPTLLFYDKNGERVLRKIGYQAPERFKNLLTYVSEEKYKSVSVRDYINSQHAINTSHAIYTQLKSDPLFDAPPYALDRSRFAASEPLMVLFEKRGCSECAEFHQDVMSLHTVRNTLDKFQVVRMDIEDETTPVLLPNGEKTTPAEWYNNTTFSRVPALIFYNEKGEQSLDTDALVQEGRMLNSLNYMLEKAYLKDWTYQQFARSKAIERSQAQAAVVN